MPKTPLRRLTYKERIRIHLFRDLGWTQTAIAQYTGIPQRTISTCLRSQVTPTKQAGRKPIIDTPTRKRLIHHATKDPEQRKKTRAQIAHELGINVCKRSLKKAFEKAAKERLSTSSTGTSNYDGRRDIFVGPTSGGIFGPPNSGIVGPPSSVTVRPPNIGIVGPPDSGVVGPPSSGIVGPPSNRIVGVPSTGIVGMPSSRIIGPPSSGVIGTPSSGTVGIPSSGIAESTSSRVVRSTNGGAVGPPSSGTVQN